MISDSDNLEQELQENLKLRRDLVAEVAKSKASLSQAGGLGSPLGLGPLLASLYRLGHWLGLRP
jgi:hypothetical protein